MKRRVSLTEGYLHRVIMESVNGVLQESAGNCKYEKELDLLIQLASQGNMTVETKSEKAAKTLYNRLRKCLDEISYLRLHSQEPVTTPGYYDSVGGYEMLLRKLKYATRTYERITERQLQYVLSAAAEIMQTTPPLATDKQSSYIAYLLNISIDNVDGKLNKYQASELIGALKNDDNLPEEITHKEAIINFYKSILN